MSVSEKKPPKAKEERKTRVPKSEAPPWDIQEDGTKTRTGKLLPYEKKLQNMFLTIAGASKLAGDDFVHNVLTNQADELAYGWARLGEENPQVRRVLALLLQGSAMTEALTPTIMVSIPILWHFGIMIPDQIGVPMAMAASGSFPMSREGEKDFKIKKAQAEAEATKSSGNGGSSGKE